MSLVRFPTELRHEIYSYLTLPKRNDLGPADGGVSISHCPPPSTLQRACRFLYYDINAYFYSVATVYLSLFSEINPEKAHAHALAAIRQARTAEFVIYCFLNMCDNTRQDYLSHEQHFAETEKEMIRALTKKAKCLKQMVVTVKHICNNTSPDLKEERLAPLKELKGEVAFVAGQVSTHGSRDNNLRNKLKLEEYVKELNAKTA